MDLGHLVQAHGYWVLALGCMIEGESVLVAAAMLAHAGYLDPAKVVAIASASAFAGDQCSYWIGRRYGPALLARMPRIAPQVERMRRLIERHPDWALAGFRFAYGLRLAAPMLIGASGIRPLRFAVFNAAGALLWATLIGALGWSFGEGAHRLFGHGWRPEAALAIGLLVAAAAYAWSRHARRR